MRDRTKSPAKALVCWFLGLTVAFAAPTCSRAQFAGPALGARPEANRLQTPTADPSLLDPGQHDLQITAGDVLVVRIFGQPEFAPPVRVSVDGSIQLPLIGVVPVAGLTVNRAEDLIAERLVNAGMYLNPQVTVQVSEAASQFVTVGGEMHAVVPVNGERRLLEVLAAAGSLPATASHIVTILRPGVPEPIVVDLGTDPTRSAQSNIRILPRDTILISRVGVVYIVGAFKAQGAIPLQQNSPLTLMQATALSGGIGFEGKYDDLRIIRTSGLERKLVTVNIRRVMMGKAPDPILQADDIVFLPSSAMKAAIKSGGIGTLSNLASLVVLAYHP